MKRNDFLSKEILEGNLNDEFSDAQFYSVEKLEDALKKYTCGNFYENEKTIKDFCQQYLEHKKIKLEEHKIKPLSGSFQNILFEVAKEKNTIEKNDCENFNPVIKIKNLEMKTLSLLSIAEHIVLKRACDKKLLQDLDISLTNDESMIAGEDLKRFVLSISSNMKLLEDLAFQKTEVELLESCNRIFPTNNLWYSPELMQGVGAFPLSFKQQETIKEDSNSYFGTVDFLNAQNIAKRR